MAYGNFKDLTRRIASDKILHDKAFNITKNPKYDRSQRGLASVVYQLFDKKNSTARALSETLQEFIFYYVLLIFLVNIHGLFL